MRSKTTICLNLCGKTLKVNWCASQNRRCGGDGSIKSSASFFVFASAVRSVQSARKGKFRIKVQKFIATQRRMQWFETSTENARRIIAIVIITSKLLALKIINTLWRLRYSICWMSFRFGCTSMNHFFEHIFFRHFFFGRCCRSDGMHINGTFVIS